MKKVKSWIFALIVIAGVAGGSSATLLVPSNSYAIDINGNPACAKTFLTFPVWYRGLTKSNTDCTIDSPSASGGISTFIWTIVLNIIDLGLQLVGYITVFFIIYGGFLFLTSSGDASGIAKAKTTILNAVIGLVISIISIAVVNLIFRIIQ